MSDKTGLLDLARGLNELGYELVGSGGTAKAIRESGLPIMCVSLHVNAHAQPEAPLLAAIVCV